MSWFPRRLYGQIVMVVSAVLITTVAGYGWFTGKTQADNALRVLKRHAEVTAENIAISCAEYLVVRNYAGMESLLLKSAEFPDIREIEVIDLTGKLLSHVIHKPGMSPTLSFDKQLSSLPSSKEIVLILNDTRMIIRQPIKAGSILGWVTLDYDTRGIGQIRKTLWKNSVLVGVLGVLASIGILLLVLRPPTRAIQKITRFAGELDRKKGETIPVIRQSVEIEQLGEALNKASLNLFAAEQTMVKNILDSVRAGIVVTDPERMQIVYINPYAANLIGLPPEQIVDQPCHNFICEAERGHCPIIEQNMKVENYERTLLLQNGEKAFVLESVVPISYSGRQHLIESFIDIADRKKAEEKLQRYAEDLKQSNEEVIAFAYTVSHDLRAPLVNIKGFSQEFKRSIREGREFLTKYVPILNEEDKKKYSAIFEHDIAEAVEFISASVDRMDSLIESILKLSRLGRSELKPEAVQTEQLVHSLLRTLQHQIESHRARVTVGTLPDLVIDRAAIERIFGNLLDNALKFLDPSRPGDIEISSEPNSDEVSFTVRDNGRGIAPDDIKKVFDPFRRVGKQDMPGDGMGLSYVRTLVKRLGGRIWCESDLDRGSCFRFTVCVKPDGV